MKGWQKKHVGDYVIQVNDTPVFSIDNIELALGLVAEAAVYYKHLKVALTFTLNKHSRNMEGMPQIQVDQLSHILWILY